MAHYINFVLLLLLLLFKNRLDRFCANQDLSFNYKSTLTETGNRSFIDSSEIIKF